jgi:uncharacterized protein (DUF433 family)
MLTVCAISENLVAHPTDEFIASDPGIMGGVPVVRGTRVPVYVILEHLEAGRSIEQVLHDYPTLTPESVRAAIRYAAELCGAG